MTRDPARDLLHDRQQKVLRTQCRGIKPGNPPSQERQSVAEIEPREKLPRLARLQTGNEVVGLVYERDGHEEQRNHQEKGDADEHEDRRHPGAVSHASQKALIHRKRQRDQNRAQKDRSDERPDDAKRRPQNGERDECEEEDAGQPPFRAAFERRVAGCRHLQNQKAESRRLNDRLGSR